MQPPVELRILGPTELSTGGQSSAAGVLRQPKRLALLAYMALAGSNGYRRRDQIVALLWPDLDQLHARTQLRKGIHALRQALGPDAFHVRGEEEIRLNLDRVWCDAVAFRQNVDAGVWTDALALYRGQLLEGLYPAGVGEEFETWLAQQRATLRESATRAAWECSSRADLSGDRDAAISYARRAAELDPDDEESIRRLIAALDRYGDRAGALRLFEKWKDRLQSEFGAEPAPETRHLARKVQAPRKGESTETPRYMKTARFPLSEAAPAIAEYPKTAPRQASRALLFSGLLLLIVIAASAGIYTTRSDFPAATLAVLPLRSGDTAGDVIAESFLDELTTKLIQLKDVQVRMSDRSAFDGTELDITKTGRSLNVRGVLESAVHRSSTGARITLRLVRISDRRAMWAGAYNLPSEADVSAHEQLAQRVVAELTPALSSLALK